MSKVLIIGCGGVASVAIHKCCQVPEVFTDICIASRTKSKCDKLAAELAPKTTTNITTAQVDADHVDEVIALIKSYQPDLVMNIALPYQDLTIMDACLACGVNYMDTANYEPENTAVQIVFITGYTDYIAEGYDVAALHYLVKPVREEKLFEVLDRAAAKLRSDSRALTLECGGEIFRVPLYEIRYLDVEKNYTTVHAKRDYTVKKTLGALSDELDERFFRIGRAAIVNLSYIRRVTKTDAILSDSAAVPLPRGAYEALNRAIIAYH